MPTQILEVDALINALSESHLLESRNAIDLIWAGATVDAHPETSARDVSLLQTYERRLNHISAFSGAHARRLAASLAEFVALLRANASAGGRFYAVKADAEYHFNVFSTRSGEIIACLPLVSKTDASEARWQELWGTRSDSSLK